MTQLPVEPVIFGIYVDVIGRSSTLPVFCEFINEFGDNVSC